MGRPEFPPSATMLLGLVAGIVATIPAAVIAFVSAGGGHGSYVAARLLFPLSFLLARFTDDSLTEPCVVLGLLQFPLYGISLGYGLCRHPRRLSRLMLAATPAIHGLAAMLCFSGLAPPGFSQ